jgi:hypothetical protein
MWTAQESWEPWAWEPPEPGPGTVVFELGEVVGWRDGEAVWVDPRAQGAGVEEALRAC